MNARNVVNLFKTKQTMLWHANLREEKCQNRFWAVENQPWFSVWHAKHDEKRIK